MATGTTTLLTVTEAAELLRVGRNTIRAWVHDGRLPALRIGGDRGRIRIPLAAIEARIADAERD